MYAGIAPQQDFFLYVPLLSRGEADPGRPSILHEPVEQIAGGFDASLVELSTWTKIILPALTIYTHACGEESEFQLVPSRGH